MFSSSRQIAFLVAYNVLIVFFFTFCGPNPGFYLQISAMNLCCRLHEARAAIAEQVLEFKFVNPLNTMFLHPLGHAHAYVNRLRRQGKDQPPVCVTDYLQTNL